MNGLFKESTIETIGKLKKGFLWTAVCLLIGGFALGAVMILANTWSSEASKVLVTMAILTLILFIGVNNFIRMEKGAKVVQGLALMGLISGIFVAILSILLIWEVLPVYSQSNLSYSYIISPSIPSAWMKMLSILSALAAAGFWISNVMSIKETNKVVKPLKITSVVCETYCAVYTIIVVFSNYEITASNLNALSAFAAFAFFVTALVAWIISRTSGKKVEEKSKSASKTDDELRAEIEEKVRREMIEKEVREKMKAEKDADK